MWSDEQGGFLKVPPFPSLGVENVNTSWAGRWVHFCCTLATQAVQEAVLPEQSAAGSAGAPRELPCQADTALLVKL